jgi:hypothetical protein
MTVPVEKPLRVHFVCCQKGGSGEIGLLRKLMADSGTCRCVEAANPEDADIIFITGILEKNIFENLRLNDVWKRYPEKSFGYAEMDNVPSFLHGVYSSAARTKGIFGRMQSCGYLTDRQNPPALTMPFYQYPKEYLFSFVGRKSHPVRKKIFRASWPGKDVFIANTTSEYNHFTNDSQNHQAMRSRYWDVMARSRFILCPRGAGASSIRLFEALQAGVAPVIYSNTWIPAAGPDWKQFAIFIPERQIHQTYEILKSRENEWEERGKRAAAAYAKWFANDAGWQQLLGAIQTIRSSQKLPEKWFVHGRHIIYCLERLHVLRLKWQVQFLTTVRKLGKSTPL